MLADVAQGGPLSARQIENAGERRKEHWGWNWSEAKHVLEYLFDSGTVGVADRNSAERRYDLAARVLPPAVLARKTPSDEESYDVLSGQGGERPGYRRPQDAHGVLLSARGRSAGVHRTAGVDGTPRTCPGGGATATVLAGDRCAASAKAPGTGQDRAVRHAGASPAASTGAVRCPIVFPRILKVIKKDNVG